VFSISKTRSDPVICLIAGSPTKTEVQLYIIESFLQFLPNTVIINNNNILLLHFLLLLPPPLWSYNNLFPNKKKRRSSGSVVYHINTTVPYELDECTITLKEHDSNDISKRIKVKYSKQYVVELRFL
jgi:hypothetical protein